MKVIFYIYVQINNIHANDLSLIVSFLISSFKNYNYNSSSAILENMTMLINKLNESEHQELLHHIRNPFRDWKAPSSLRTDESSLNDVNIKEQVVHCLEKLFII